MSDNKADLSALRITPVTQDNWRQCAGLRVRREQRRYVADVTYYLCLCAYEQQWHPVAVTEAGRVVAFAMWAREGDGSHWIGGVVVSAQEQGRGIGRWLVRSLMDRLIVEPGCVTIALSYEPENSAARTLYRSLGFVETGERDGTELVARWSGSARGPL